MKGVVELTDAEKEDYEIDPVTGRKRRKNKPEQEIVQTQPIKPSSFSDAAITRRMLRGGSS